MHAHTRTATLFRVCQSMLRRAGSLNTPGRATRVKLTPESSLMMMTTRACVRGKSAEQDEGGREDRGRTAMSNYTHNCIIMYMIMQ